MRNNGNSDRFYFHGLQNHCRWWRQSSNEKTLALWKKIYYQPTQHIKKQRHYFANKVSSSQSYGFPGVMYGYQSWAIKKAECQRIDSFEVWCWRRILRVFWRSYQSVLKEISPGYSLDTEAETPMLGPPGAKNWLNWKRPWCEERLKAGEEGDDRGWDHWMASLTRWT